MLFCTTRDFHFKIVAINWCKLMYHVLKMLCFKYTTVILQIHTKGGVAEVRDAVRSRCPGAGIEKDHDVGGISNWES